MSAILNLGCNYGDKITIRHKISIFSSIILFITFKYRHMRLHLLDTFKCILDNYFTQSKQLFQMTSQRESSSVNEHLSLPFFDLDSLLTL